MPTVRVPRTRVTPDEVIMVLGRRLGAGYRIDRGDGRSVRVSRSALAGAEVAIRDVAGATVFRVRGRVPLASFGTARRVAGALRQSAEFRSL